MTIDTILLIATFVILALASVILIKVTVDEARGNVRQRKEKK